MDLPREHHRLPSEAMGRPMHLWRFGHFGQPIVVFPTAAGFAHEWEAQGMLDALADLVAAGRIKLYCTESNVAEAWTRKEEHPASRIRRHVAFERYLLEELVPFIRHDCRGDVALAAAGCSLGGFYAANAALKFPETFRWALCMSGRYQMTHFTGGFTNSDVYFNDPLAYVPGLGGEALERVRRHTHLTLVCGQGRWEEGCIEETQALADLLQAKRIRHSRDIWGHDVSHEWPWWRRQARFHLHKAFG
jgi:esterase/lipase superfamily enzyme